MLIRTAFILLAFLPVSGHSNSFKVPATACDQELKFRDFAVTAHGLSLVIDEGFNRNYSGSPTKSFRTHYDWHSSVHAHWARLVLARWSGQPGKYNQLMNRLSLDELQDIQRVLRSYPSYEMPYGRAWLVLLLDEVGQNSLLPAARKLANEFKTELAQDLIGFVNSSREENEGAYNSWLLPALLLTNTSGFSGEIKTRLQLALQQKQPLLEKISARSNYSRSDFFSMGAVASALLGKSFGPRMSIEAAEAELRASSHIGAGHNIGVYASELWVLSKAARSDVVICNEYIQRLNDILQRPELWAEDYDRVSHWVPQFLFFSIWSAFR